MPQITVEDLVNEHRIRDESILGIILYVPFGTLLLLFRVIIGLIVWLTSAVLPEISPIRLIISNITCFTLGLFIKTEGQRDEKSKVIVSNYISIFDPFVLHVVAGSITPSKWDLPPPLAWALGIRHLGSPTTNEQYREAVVKKFSDIPNIPISTQPEGCPTNGKGLLKFSEWPFMISNKVQPAAIEIKRCFGNVTVASLSHWNSDGIPWGDLLCFLWNPYTVYTINFLAPIEKNDTETMEEFAERTQKSIATSLKIESTKLTSNELRTLISNREAEREIINAASPNRREGAQPGSTRPDLMRMANQVKEVLPAVPLNVILKDLGRTRSVDVTLTNILEGTVPYTPEDVIAPPAPTSSSVSTNISTLCPPPLNTAASTFQKTAEGRQLSFRERKAQLIQEARRRYCEKHGLTHFL